MKKIIIGTALVIAVVSSASSTLLAFDTGPGPLSVTKLAGFGTGPGPLAAQKLADFNPGPGPMGSVPQN